MRRRRSPGRPRLPSFFLLTTRRSCVVVSIALTLILWNLGSVHKYLMLLKTSWDPQNSIESSTSPTSEDSSTHQRPPAQQPLLRTLVILMGNLRGGERAWQTLYDQVLTPNQADLALLIGETRPAYQNASLFSRAKYVWPVPEYDDWADAIDTVQNSTVWRRTVLPYLTSDSDGVLGGVGDARGSGAVIFTMRHFLTRRLLRSSGVLEKYDRFVITRADHYYLCQHDLSALSNQYLWVPRGEDWHGITDRHLVVSRAHVLQALDILPPVLDRPQDYARILGHENPERLILQRWKEEGLFPLVRRFDRTMFTCGEKGDSTRWRRLGGLVREGVYLKYEDEYKASYDTCGVCQSNYLILWKKSGWTVCLSDYIPLW